MSTVDVKTLEALVSPVVQGLGYDFVDLEWRHEAGTWVLRIFIDHQDPGDLAKLDEIVAISHVDCSRVSQALSTALDEVDVIHVHYTMEVSSPGLDRPLRREADFRRFVGRKASIKTKHPLMEGAVPRRNFGGTLMGVDSGKVRIDVDGRLFEIPVADVEKANLEYEM